MSVIDFILDLNWALIIACGTAGFAFSRLKRVEVALAEQHEALRLLRAQLKEASAPDGEAG